MRRKLRLQLPVLALAITAVMLVACSGSSANTDPAAIEGDWVLESFGGTTDLVPADPTVTTTLKLGAGHASGNGGVNSFSGSYEAGSDGRISFGELASTLMAGPTAAMDQETEFFAALGDAARFEVNQGKLVLSNSGNNTLVVMVPR